MIEILDFCNLISVMEERITQEINTKQAAQCHVNTSVSFTRADENTRMKNRSKNKISCHCFSHRNAATRN